MKRNCATQAVSFVFGRAGGRAFFRLGLALATVLLFAACARFERRWARAVEAPPRNEAPEVGAWEGTWTSPPTGHSGRLRCVIEAPPPGTTEGEFTYHATWGGLSGTFPTRQPVRRERDGTVKSVGAWTLPRLIGGGRYDYDITVRGDRFTGTWRSRRDSGRLEMVRVRPPAR